MNLNVVIITQGITRIVLPLINSEHNIVGIIEDAPRDYNETFISIIKRKVFGIYKFLKCEPTLKSLAAQEKISYFFFKKHFETDLKKWLQIKNPDIIVVYSMSKLLKPIIFEIPKYGTLNLHPSYLPEYPGRNPWFWTYVNMDLNPGVTLHFIDKGEDTGDIVYQQRYSLTLGMESPAMHDIAIGQVGLTLILKALDTLSKTRTLPRIKQSQVNKNPKANQIGINENIIDFNEWGVERIWHILKGTQQWYNPIPQPKGIYKGQRWSILNYKKSTNHHSPSANLGQIVKEERKYLLHTIDGIIYLKPTFSIKTLIKYIFTNNV